MRANPITRWREENGMSRADVCMLAGVCYPTLYAVETGLSHSLGHKLAEGLEAAGVDSRKLQEEVEAWTKERSRELREGLK